MAAFPTNRTSLKAVSFECSVGRQVLRAWGEHHEQMRNGRGGNPCGAIRRIRRGITDRGSACGIATEPRDEVGPHE